MDRTHQREWQPRQNGDQMNANRPVDFLLDLETNSATPLYRQIYDQIRKGIVTGVLGAGERLPSIRRIAADHRISHITVEQAYTQLASEGFVRSIPRCGYVVEHLDAAYLQSPSIDNGEEVRKLGLARSRDRFLEESALGKGSRYDFSYANLQPDSFPVKTWRRIINDILCRNTHEELARYWSTDEQGSLCKELARYLGQSRGVNCVPEQVILQPGTAEALGTILQLFNREDDVIGMEEPGYATVGEVAKRLGFRMTPLPVDQGAQAFVSAVRSSNAKIVFLTPSHQFPTGSHLGLESRIEILKWAAENAVFIIEDDSCCEYRHNTQPIPSLQSLDAHNRTIYLSNFSKALSPSMRMAYMVLPPELLGRYLNLYNYAHPSVPWLEQEAVARFIAEGHWEGHIRKMSLGNRKRNERIVDCLTKTMGSRISIQGDATGMHLYVTVHNGMTQEELIESAARHGARVYDTRRFWFSKPAPKGSVIIGYSSIDIDDIQDGVNALHAAWFGDSL